MSIEAHVYMRHHQDAKVKHFYVSNVIYHKFLHGAVSYTLNGENVKVMLEYCFKGNILFQKQEMINIPQTPNNCGGGEGGGGLYSTK